MHEPVWLVEFPSDGIESCTKHRQSDFELLIEDHDCVSFFLAQTSGCTGLGFQGGEMLGNLAKEADEHNSNNLESDTNSA
jgi:hypothetical protein